VSAPAERVHRTRRGGAVLLVLLLAVLSLGTSAPVAHAAGGVKVTVTTLSPAVATAGSTLQVAGTVTNTGTQTVRRASVRVRLSDTRLNSRSELVAVMAGRVSSRDGQVIVEAPLDDLAPGTSAPFDLRQPLDEVTSLTGFGVYALGVEVVGARGGGDPGRLAFTRTLLPWVPATPDFRPTGFSWVWPLVDAPVRLANGRFADDSLAADLAVGGRLDRLLQAGVRLQQPGAAVTWAIDPDLVATVADMADGNGYRVVSPDGGTVPGGGGGLAQRWLGELRDATAGRDVLALPYADPDLAALVHHGREADIARALDVGAGVFAQQLPAASIVDGLSWPINGYLDRDTLAALSRADVTATVLDGRALPTTIDLSYTPSGRAQLTSGAGRVAALVADPGLADLLGRARPRTANPVLAAQRVVAETAMITSELPSTGTARTIVAMPPRRWDPSQEFLDQLQAMSVAPWAAPVSLRALAESRPPEVDRSRLRYPRAQRAQELPESYLLALDVYGTSITTFGGILTDPTPLVPRLQLSLLRLESSWWRDRDSARGIRLDREKKYLSDLRQRVRVQPGSFTFGSKSGKIPLTLVNGLPQEVIVVLRLEPQTLGLRLAPVKPQRIGPNQKIQVEVQATAVANGPVAVSATLHTRSGEPYSQPVLLRVNVTQIGSVALVITVGSAVVLFLAAGIRVVRRVRAARRAEPGTGPAEPDPSDHPADVTL
jgi:Family of unknown function (DUF6049)